METLEQKLVRLAKLARLTDEPDRDVSRDVYRRATFLYRCYDRDNVLLYVGVSLHVEARLLEHRRKPAPWFGRLARCTVQSQPSRIAAEAAEKRAIKNEKPLFNKAHA